MVYAGNHGVVVIGYSALHDKRKQLLADVFYGGSVSYEGMPRDLSEMEMHG